jgi:hypothetical protein
VEIQARRLWVGDLLTIDRFWELDETKKFWEDVRGALKEMLET